jgi:hypothetical protein
MLREDRLGAMRIIYDLFVAHSEQLTIADFGQDIFEVMLWRSGIEVFREIIDEFVSEQNINHFKHSPILISIAMMLRTLETAHCPSDEWIEATRHLIALGTDIHGFKNDGSTLTTSVMGLADHPFDSIYIGDTWLDTLREAGVDVSEHLEAEIIQHIEHPKSRTEEILIGIEYKFSGEENKRRISWDWVFSLELGVFDVLNEFKHFGPTQHLVEDDYYDSIIHGRGKLHNWPYLYPDWIYCEYWEFGGNIDQNTSKVLKCARSRFERRQRKKALKLAKAQGLHRGPNIPGAWID